MADSIVIGNCILLAGFGGLLIWIFVFRRISRNLPPIPGVEIEPVEWDAVPTMVTLLVGYVSPFLFYGWLTSVGGEVERTSLANLQRQLMAIGGQWFTVLVLMFLSPPVTRAKFGFMPGHWRTDICVGLGGWLACFVPIVLIRIAQSSSGFNDPEGEHLLFKILSANRSDSVYAWIFASAVILAPMTEELFYRVLLQGFVESRTGPVQAIVASTLFFVVQHSFYDWIALIPLALVLGYIYHRRRSYLAVVTMHAVFNGVMLALSLLHDVPGSGGEPPAK